jgi:hypothetical protein
MEALRLAQTWSLGKTTTWRRFLQATKPNQSPIAPVAVFNHIRSGMNLGHPRKTWHEILDDRSLEMDWVTADKIRANPKLVQIALAKIERWLANPDYSESNRQAVLEWKRIIENSSLDALLSLL